MQKNRNNFVRDVLDGKYFEYKDGKKLRFAGVFCSSGVVSNYSDNNTYVED